MKLDRVLRHCNIKVGAFVSERYINCNMKSQHKIDILSVELYGLRSKSNSIFNVTINSSLKPI